MDYIVDNLIEGIKNKENVSISSGEEYFYLLGQILSAVFIKIGGFDKFRSEFNYLTNPYIPRSIMDIRKRVLNFIGNIKKYLAIDNEVFEELFKILLEFNIIWTPSSFKDFEDAFYGGLYADNKIIDFLN